MRRSYDEAEIRELASKCRNKTDFSNKNQSAYKAARRLGIINDLEFLKINIELGKLKEGITHLEFFEIVRPFVDFEIAKRWDDLIKILI
jgi:hypothetical protein